MRLSERAICRSIALIFGMLILFLLASQYKYEDNPLLEHMKMKRFIAIEAP
jgi:hypothetical protein